MLRAVRYWMRVGLLLWLVMIGQVALTQQLNPDAYPPKVAEVIKHSVVRLGDARSSGTGFLVSNQGHIVTAWHVLEAINQRRVPNGKISYVKSVYQVNFSGSGKDCPVLADLIGASVFRDIAALRIRPHTWAKRDEDGYCLNGVKPVEIDWHLDPTGDTSLPDYPYFSDPHFPIGFPAKCADWTKEAPTWAGQGNGFHCPLRGFNAFKTGVRRAEDELGLIELSEAVEHGFSGGPVVLENGRVVGMTILRDWEEKNAVSRLIPSPMLEGPLWTFGVAVDKRNRVLGDHHEAMLDYISRKDDIESALTAFEQMYSYLRIPELIREQSGFLKVASAVAPDGFAYLPQFMFERRWTNAPDPTMFEISHHCVHKNAEVDSLLSFSKAAVNYEDTHKQLFKMLRNRLTFPNDIVSVQLAAGATANETPPKRKLFPLQVTGGMSHRAIDLGTLIWQCSSKHEAVLTDLIEDFKENPSHFKIKDDAGNSRLNFEGQTIKSFETDGFPDVTSQTAYSGIVFSISAVVMDGDDEELHHRYERLLLSLDPISEVGHVR